MPSVSCSECNDWQAESVSDWLVTPLFVFPSTAVISPETGTCETCQVAGRFYEWYSKNKFINSAEKNIKVDKNLKR